MIYNIIDKLLFYEIHELSIGRIVLNIGFDYVLKLVTGERIRELKMILEKHSRRKIDNTLLTLEETVILLMINVLGYKPDKIAEILGVSRSSVYAAIKRAKQKADIAKKTISYYNGLTKTIRISVRRGEDLRSVIEKIFSEADRLGLKLPFRSIEIAEELRRIGVAGDEYIIKDSSIIIIPGIGIFHIEKVNEL